MATPFNRDAHDEADERVARRPVAPADYAAAVADEYDAIMMGMEADEPTGAAWSPPVIDFLQARSRLRGV